MLLRACNQRLQTQQWRPRPAWAMQGSTAFQLIAGCSEVAQAWQTSDRIVSRGISGRVGGRLGQRMRLSRLLVRRTAAHYWNTLLPAVTVLNARRSFAAGSLLVPDIIRGDNVRKSLRRTALLRFRITSIVFIAALPDVCRR